MGPLSVPKAIGFHQIQGLLWEAADLAKTGPDGWIVCANGEDPNCIDSIPWSKTVGKDHDFYLNHSMWCCDATPTNHDHPTAGACSFPFGKSQGEGIRRDIVV